MNATTGQGEKGPEAEQREYFEYYWIFLMNGGTEYYDDILMSAATGQGEKGPEREQREYFGDGKLAFISDGICHLMNKIVGDEECWFCPEKVIIDIEST